MADKKPNKTSIQLENEYIKMAQDVASHISPDYEVTNTSAVKGAIKLANKAKEEMISMQQKYNQYVEQSQNQ